MNPMDYSEWIGRERRIRIKLLMSSSVIKNTGIFHVCQSCAEVCLCHEFTCPNCGSSDIIEQKIEEKATELLSEKRIRCQYRYKNLKITVFNKMNE